MRTTSRLADCLPVLVLVGPAMGIQVLLIAVLGGQGHTGQGVRVQQIKFPPVLLKAAVVWDVMNEASVWFWTATTVGAEPPRLTDRLPGALGSRRLVVVSHGDI